MIPQYDIDYSLVREAQERAAGEAATYPGRAGHPLHAG